MSQSGDPLENAIAERVNGILKEEFLRPLKLSKTFSDIVQQVHQVIHTYNHHRPHMSCDMLTPAKVHQMDGGELRKHWKNYTRAIIEDY